MSARGENMAEGSADRPRSDRERDGNGHDRASQGRSYEDTAPEPISGDGPDVYLNVPMVKVDEIAFELDNLEAHVSLSAAVLDLLKLTVGADVFLGKVNLEIKGVEAQALLEVRLDNVAVIVDRVLTTLDRNPEILRHIGRGVESAARGIGSGAGEAVGELGKGAGGAVEDVGKGASQAVGELGKGAGGAVEDVGKGAGGAVEGVGKGAGEAVEGVGKGAGEAVEGVGKGAGGAVEGVGQEAGGAVRGVGEGAGRAAEGAGKAAEGAGKTAGDALGGVSQSVGRTADGNGGNGGGGGRQDSSGNDDQESDDATLQGALRDAQESVAGLRRVLEQMRRGDGGS
jgi:hypothetical protein